MPHHSGSVGVFAKYPLAGQVKTRLIPLLGPQCAAEFARYLILSTLSRLWSPLQKKGVAQRGGLEPVIK